MPAQNIHAGAAAGTEGNACRGLIVGGTKARRGAGQIALIVDHGKADRVRQRRIGEVGFRVRAALLRIVRVDNQQHVIGTVDFVVRAADAFALYGIAGVAQPGRVDQVQRQAIDLYVLVQGVAGGSRDSADDRCVALRQSIEQA